MSPVALNSFKPTVIVVVDSRILDGTIFVKDSMDMVCRLQRILH